MPETEFYKIDFRHNSSMSLAFDELHATEIVEAPKNISFKELEQLCYDKIPGFHGLNSFKTAYVRKLV